MKLIRALINSNIYISLAAVMLTVATQIQLGMRPDWRPYLFLIFFATLCEYNVHRFVTVITKKEALESNKHKWVKDNLIAFYILVFLSITGFAVAVFFAKHEVLIGLAPIALITLFYSIPVYGNKRTIFRLRGIPYLKIFLISITWSVSTILLPVIESGEHVPPWHIIMMLAERFIFIFAISIPFDIRDIDADRTAGLKTIPLLMGEKRSMAIAYLCVLIFTALSVFHYSYLKEPFIVIALIISSFSTLLFLKWDRAKKLPLYHYAILDGAMLLQGTLVVGFSYLN